MERPPLEVADIFRAHGPAFRIANAGHLGLDQLKVMSAIENLPGAAALGGHVERCEDCGLTRIAYHSCGNRHCPKRQAAAAKQWLAEREAELPPVAYYHVVFTLPAALGALPFANKAVVYDLLFKAAAETLTTIAADPRASGRAHRPYRRAAHLGFGAHPSSPYGLQPMRVKPPNTDFSHENVSWSAVICCAVSEAIVPAPVAAVVMWAAICDTAGGLMLPPTVAF